MEQVKSDFETQKSELQGRIDELESRVAELEATIKRLESEQGETVPRTDLEAKNDEIAALTTDKSTAEESLKAANAELEELKAANATLEEEKAALVPKADLEAREETIAEKTAAAESLTKEKEELEAQIAALQKELDNEKTTHGETFGKLSDEHASRGTELEGYVTLRYVTRRKCKTARPPVSCHEH